VAFTALMNRVLAGQASRAEQERFGREMNELSCRVLDLPERDLFSVAPIDRPPPPGARIFASAACARCGEWTMVTRLAAKDGALLCAPCRGEAG
jgi:formylmethanofuran dehydrogenase subunit E